MKKFKCSADDMDYIELGESIDEQGDLRIELSTNNFVGNVYINLNDLENIHKHLGEIISEANK